MFCLRFYRKSRTWTITKCGLKKSSLIPEEDYFLDFMTIGATSMAGWFKSLNLGSGVKGGAP